MNEKLKAIAETRKMVKHMEVMRLHPQDIIVLRCTQILPPDAVDRIRRHFESTILPKHRCIVLDSTMEIAAIRPVIMKQRKGKWSTKENDHGSEDEEGQDEAAEAGEG